tara:strand:- start:197 stop:352 length:156 start_codon:yes stop_codon:yes gene_type:complete
VVGVEDEPAVHLNTMIMENFAPKLKPFYYDETKYDSYMEQLGIIYPTLKKE